MLSSWIYTIKTNQYRVYSLFELNAMTHQPTQFSFEVKLGQVRVCILALQSHVLLHSSPILDSLVWLSRPYNPIVQLDQVMWHGLRYNSNKEYFDQGHIGRGEKGTVNLIIPCLCGPHVHNSAPNAAESMRTHNGIYLVVGSGI